MGIIGVVTDFYNLLNVIVGMRNSLKFDRGVQTTGKDLTEDFSTSAPFLLTFWTDNFLLWGPVLYIVGYLAASLASTH